MTTQEINLTRALNMMVEKSAYHAFLGRERNLKYCASQLEVSVDDLRAAWMAHTGGNDVFAQYNLLP